MQMVRFFLIFLFFFSISGILPAQPNVTPAHLPKPGDALTLSIGSRSEIFSVQSGPGQTWNYTNLTLSPGDTQVYESPSGSPGSGFFSQATAVVSAFGANQFFRVSDLGFDYLGDFIPGMANPVLATQTCARPIPLIPLGLSFNQERVVVSNRIRFDSLGPDSYSRQVSTIRNVFRYIAWGTLTAPNLPARPVQVIRVVTSGTDSLFSATSLSGPYTFEEVEPMDQQLDRFLFLQAQSPALVLEMEPFSNGDGDDGTVFRFQYPVSVTDGAALWQHPGVRLFPNPACLGTDLVLEAIPPKTEWVRFWDGLGREVATVSAAGETFLRVPAHNLGPGVYSVRFLGPGQTQTSPAIRALILP